MYSDNVILLGNKATKIKYVPVVEEKEINITLDSLESDINKMTYLGCYPQYSEKDYAVENLSIPPLVDCFYSFVYENMRVPKQQELWEYYLETNSNSLHEYNGKVHINYLTTHASANANAYKGWFLRTYPSILRDFHVWVMLNDNDYFKGKAKYSLAEDKNKVDITITDNDKDYYIGLAVDTTRSREFIDKKQYRHDKRDVKYFLLNLSKGKTLGNSQDTRKRFILYPNSLLEDIREYIKSA